MKVISASVFDPTTEGDFASEQQIELTVDGISITRPDHTNVRPNGTSYIVYEYGENLINFVDTEGVNLHDEYFDSGEERRNSFEQILSDFNTSGATEFSYFPVIVSVGIFGRRELYASVAWLDTVMVEQNGFCRQGIAGGRWHLELDRESALTGHVVWRLCWSEYQPRLSAMPRAPYVIDALD